MKTVVQNPYHLWAHQAQSHARNASDNRSFNGAAALSYATEVARIHLSPKKGGEPLYLLTTHKYNNTTNRHMSEIRLAIPNRERIVNVPNVDPRSLGDHRKNADYLLTDAAEFIAKSKRARLAWHKAWHLEQAQDKYRQLRLYVDHFKLKRAAKLSDIFDEAAITAQLEKLEKQAEKERKERAKKEAAANAERLERAKEILAQWLAGEAVTVPWILTNAYLRIAPNDPETVETSLQAAAPLEHVRKALPLVLRALESGAEFVPETDIRLGHYRLNSVSNGIVTVGCHRFERDEALRFAAVLEAQK